MYCIYSEEYKADDGTAAWDSSHAATVAKVQMDSTGREPSVTAVEIKVVDSFLHWEAQACDQIPPKWEEAELGQLEEELRQEFEHEGQPAKRSHSYEFRNEK